MLELKKVKIHNDMSEETTCFSAEMWENGKLIGYVKNDGRGGCDHMTPTGADPRACRKYEDNYKESSYPVSDLLDEWVTVSKLQAKNLVFKDKDGEMYSIGFGKLSIAQAKRHPEGIGKIMFAKVREEKKGSKFLNRNV